jgi:hypothetical protein
MERKMDEKYIEQAFRKAVRDSGGIALKFVSPGFSGVPDRLVLMPHGRMAFVEVKAPGEKPRALQLSRHRLLRQLGFKAFVLDNTSDIPKIIEEVMQNEAS